MRKKNVIYPTNGPRPGSCKYSFNDLPKKKISGFKTHSVKASAIYSSEESSSASVQVSAGTTCPRLEGPQLREKRELSTPLLICQIHSFVLSQVGTVASGLRVPFPVFLKRLAFCPDIAGILGWPSTAGISLLLKATWLFRWCMVFALGKPQGPHPSHREGPASASLRGRSSCWTCGSCWCSLGCHRHPPCLTAAFLQVHLWVCP